MVVFCWFPPCFSFLFSLPPLPSHLNLFEICWFIDVSLVPVSCVYMVVDAPIPMRHNHNPMNIVLNKITRIKHVFHEPCNFVGFIHCFSYSFYCYRFVYGCHWALFALDTRYSRYLPGKNKKNKTQ